MENPQPNKVSKDVAENEFNSWLSNWRRIPERLITDKEPDTQSSINNCVQNIMDGTLKVNNDTGEITQKLRFPIGEGKTDNPVVELTYGHKLTADAFDGNRKFKNADEHVKMRVMISKLSGVPISLISKMDHGDIAVASELMYFHFL